jgi:hypothetical protein
MRNKIETILAKHFRYTDFSGDIGGKIWTLKDNRYDNGEISNDFSVFITELLKECHIYTIKELTRLDNKQHPQYFVIWEDDAKTQLFK